MQAVLSVILFLHAQIAMLGTLKLPTHVRFALISVKDALMELPVLTAKMDFPSILGAVYVDLGIT